MAPSGESAEILDFPVLSLLNVPKSVFVAQFSPDHMVARLSSSGFILLNTKRPRVIFPPLEDEDPAAIFPSVENVKI
ncbi:MAG TPA: hypothetical protein ACQGQH_08715 [Xylella sp.]